jgi:hypothetical protein
VTVLANQVGAAVVFTAADAADVATGDTGAPNAFLIAAAPTPAAATVEHVIRKTLAEAAATGVVRARGARVVTRSTVAFVSQQIDACTVAEGQAGVTEGGANAPPAQARLARATALAAPAAVALVGQHTNAPAVAAGTALPTAEERGALLDAASLFPADQAGTAFASLAAAPPVELAAGGLHRSGREVDAKRPAQHSRQQGHDGAPRPALPQAPGQMIEAFAFHGGLSR